MALGDITREVVLTAIAEFDELGRDAFLEKYGFKPARRYLIRHAGRRYDSKAIVGAAHGFLPGRSPLKAADFSGGVAVGQAARVLRDLGFEVADGDTEDPVADVIGAIMKMQTAFAGGRPMLKQGVVLLWAIGRAHAGQPRLQGWQETSAGLVPLLERYRRESEGERGRPDYPIAALQRAGLWDMVGLNGVVPPAHGDTALKAWFQSNARDGGLPRRCYDLVRYSGQARIRVIDAILDKYFEDFDTDELLRAVGLHGVDIVEDEPKDGTATDPEAWLIVDVDDSAAAAAEYARWCALIERRENETRGRRMPVTFDRPIRLRMARQAVLRRSGGRCENPDCGRRAPDINDRGEPVLEVDHVDPIADGGRDHPIQMIALCPNCHAVKTRGRSRGRLMAQLAAAAQRLHDRALCTADRPSRSSTR